jgi:D-alanine-D-alanine ligase
MTQLAMEGQSVRKPLKTGLDITVLMGGPSTERDVSLTSGQAVAEALQRLGHRVTRADISPHDTTALDRKGAQLVFIVLHGAFGESGEVQALCESRSLPYTGSGVSASALAMDKCRAKQVYRAAGLATPDWVVLGRDHARPAEGDLDRLGLPAVIKPIDGGSSVDVTIARSAAERDMQVHHVLSTYGSVLVERFIAGREFTVGVLGERALPPIEIVTQREFYDKTAKYADDAGTQYRFDHGLAPDAQAQLGRLALEAHRALGCRDMSRTDFILDAAGNAHILETNTIPGFTSHSLLPKAAQRVGLSFDDLVAKLVAMAISRAPAK